MSLVRAGNAAGRSSASRLERAHQRLELLLELLVVHHLLTAHGVERRPPGAAALVSCASVTLPKVVLIEPSAWG